MKIEIEHPGIMLKEDFLDDLGVKLGSFARAIGVDRAAIKHRRKACHHSRHGTSVRLIFQYERMFLAQSAKRL